MKQLLILLATSILIASCGNNCPPCDWCSPVNTISGNMQDVFIPTVITPNGDGMNDLLFIQKPDTMQIKVEIWNEKGTKVFNDNNYDNSWDATQNGVALGEGQYEIEVMGTAFSYEGKLTILRTLYECDDCLPDCSPVDQGDPLLGF